jgi:DNA-binding NtrC family response regulator
MPQDCIHILIVDDEAQVCELLKEQLSGLGYCCYSALNAAGARKLLEKETVDVVLLDIWLPDINGVELLKEISQTYPDIVCIMQTAANDLATAVESMKSGASDYITKPFELDRVSGAIQNALSRKAADAGKAKSQEPDPVINEIEAISLGVEARQEMLDIHSEKVLQQTLNIAHQMGFPESKIEAWIKYHRQSRDSRIKHVSDSISKLVNPD